MNRLSTEQLCDGARGRPTTVRYIDREHAETNAFTVTRGVV
jgi:hypothetical protein